jgi:hypothetical protein
VAFASLFPMMTVMAYATITHRLTSSSPPKDGSHEI